HTKGRVHLRPVSRGAPTGGGRGRQRWRASARSDLDRGDLDQLVGESDLHTMNARHQPVERELAEIVDLALKSAGRALRDDPGPGQVWLARGDLAKHPQTSGDGAVPNFEVNLDPACLIHQTRVVQ